MTASKGSFVQLRQTLRPARAAVAIDRDDPYWLHSIVRLIEQLTMTWGGSSALIVPVTDAGDVDQNIWDLVRVQDPDIWGVYQHSFTALLLADPAEFERQLELLTQRRLSEGGGNPAEIREALRSAMLNRSGGLVDPISPALLDRLAKWTGISTGVDGRVDIEYLAADAEVGERHHLTAVAALEPLPPTVTTLDLDLLPMDLSMSLRAMGGALDEPSRDHFAARGVNIETVKLRPDDVGAVLAHAWGIRNWFGSTVTDADTGSSIDLRELFSQLPASLPTVGCLPVRRFSPGAETYPVTVVVGDEIEDFAYSLAQMRCTGRSIWLPTSALDDLDDPTVRGVVRTLSRSGQSSFGDRPVMLCSLSEPAVDLSSLASAITDAALPNNRPTVEFGAPTPPPERILSLVDRRHYDVQLDELVSETEMQRGVPLVVPSEVDSSDPSALKWWIDIRNGERVLPPRSALNQSVAPRHSGTYSYEIVRSADGAIAFSSHTTGLVIAGARRDDALVRPRLRFPNASDVFAVLFKRSGIDATTSDKGRFQNQTMALWGGLDLLASDLDDVNISELLNGWLATSSDGSEPGMFAQQRRFLTFDDCAAVSGLDADTTRSVLDRYLNTGIVRRGHVLRCDFCRHLDWYPLDAVGRTFTCHRCESSNTPSTQGTPTSTHEITVAYDLSEVVYQFLQNNGHVPVLALQRLAQQSRSFMFAPEMQLDDPSNAQRMELDLLAMADGRIIVGEAKRSQRLADTLTNERSVLTRVLRAAEHATADRIVLATTTTWRDETKQVIDQALGTSRFEIQLLEDLGPQPESNG